MSSPFFYQNLLAPARRCAPSQRRSQILVKKWQKSCIDVNFEKTGYFCKIPDENVEIRKITRSKMSKSGNIYVSIWLYVSPERNSYIIRKLSKLDVLEISEE